MSLFYGYNRLDTVTNKHLNGKLREVLNTEPDYKVIFDLNVTRSSKNAVSRLHFVDYIEDRDGEIHSAMFWRPSSVNPQLNTAGDHHFLYPESSIRTAFHANVPRFMFTDVSVFVVVKRNSVRSASGAWETIVSNANVNDSRSLGFKAGVSNRLVFGGMTPSRFHECTIPAKFVGKRILISAHWLSGVRVSHVRINGEILRDSYTMCDIGQLGTPYLSVLGVNSLKSFYSDISFYGMRIVDGRLGEPEIGRICKEVMAEYGL